MSDILLSSEKQSRFETMIEREIENEFGEQVDAKVKASGKVLVFSSDSYGKAEVMKRKDEVFEVLRDVEFEFRQSSYELVEGDQKLVGASFYLRRDGW